MNRRRPGVVTSVNHPDSRLRGSRYTVPFATLWDAALRIAHGSRRWVVSHEDPVAGLIVVEATSLIFRFVDHVVIRVTLDENGFTRVDVSSHSRVGFTDFGKNRRRIIGFLRNLDREIRRR
ncbi:hypothetical protein BH23GEM6_BH23GEM6_06550 [soil metagenome]